MTVMADVEPSAAPAAETAPDTEVHTLNVYTGNGTDTLTWTAGDDAAVAAARTKFSEQLAAGYMAYETKAPGDHVTTREFDPAARSVTLSRPIQGG